MSDDSSRKAARPVSVRKSGTGATSAAAGVAKPNMGNRPRTVMAAAVATVACGLFAVIAALTLYGQHDFLVNQIGKQVLTTSQITSATNAASDAFDSSKKNNNSGKVSDDLKSNLTDAKNDSTRAIADADVTDQAKMAKTAAQNATSGTQLASTVRSDLTKLQKKQHTDALNSANKAPSQQLIASVVLLLICALLGFSVWRGRYWSRWAVLALWALSSFTGATVAGINTLLGAFSTTLPGVFKGSIVVASAAMLIAVVLVLLPSSARYFALSRPAPRPGAPQRRGLFAPRVPPADRTARTARTAAAQAERVVEDPDRARSKKRTATNAQAVAKGADLARTRAKAASKSRRTSES